MRTSFIVSVPFFFLTGTVVAIGCGSKPVNGPCRSRIDCDSLSCVGNSLACGKCVARLAAGADCTESAQCPRAGFCNTKCYATAFLGDSCDTYNLCGNGLVCTAGKCVKAGGVGAPCTTEAQCDLAALIGCNKATGQCEAYTFAQPTEACPAMGAMGPPVLCSKGSSCIRPGVAQPGTCVVNAKVGETCGADKRCEAFINCTDSKCVLPTYVACP